MSRPLTAAKVTRRLQVRQCPGMRTRNRSTNSASMAAESPSDLWALSGAVIAIRLIPIGAASTRPSFGGSFSSGKAGQFLSLRA